MAVSDNEQCLTQEVLFLMFLLSFKYNKKNVPVQSTLSNIRL